jgi:HlyD family secretion protein
VSARAAQQVVSQRDARTRSVQAIRVRCVSLVAVSLATASLALGCGGAEDAPPYRAVSVVRKAIRVTAEAAGVIEPVVTVEVKSKASGEILELPVETGSRVERDAVIVRIDPRQPRNALELAEAELRVATARKTVADGQLSRAQRLFAASSIAETQLEQAQLEAANAQAEVVRARVNVENARIRLDDTQVVAPIAGTVLEKNVERGQVITSPTTDVSGGTVLLRMADLDVVQVRTLIDETDIGKLRVGMPVRTLVATYPELVFQGEISKIEPSAQTEQAVTRFPVLVRLDNPQGLLRPGMNAEVAVQIDDRPSVLAVPNAALIPPRDLGLYAGLLDIALEREPSADESAVAAPSTPDATAGEGSGRREEAGPRAPAAPASAGDATGALAARRDPTAAPHRAAVRGRTQDLRRGRAGGEGGGLGGAARAETQDGGARRSRDPRGSGSYVVLVMRTDGSLEPRRIRVGITDLDDTEVVAGLAEGEQVVLVPTPDLVRFQQRRQERIQSRTGGGLLGGGGR